MSKQERSLGEELRLVRALHRLTLRKARGGHGDLECLPLTARDGQNCPTVPQLSL